MFCCCDAAACTSFTRLCIHLQLSKSEKAAELESALEKSGHTSLLPVFEEMAAAKCFELDKDSDEKESRLWVDNLDPAQLLRYFCALIVRWHCHDDAFTSLCCCCCWPVSAAGIIVCA